MCSCSSLDYFLPFSLLVLEARARVPVRYGTRSSPRISLVPAEASLTRACAPCSSRIDCLLFQPSFSALRLLARARKIWEPVLHGLRWPLGVGVRAQKRCGLAMTALPFLRSNFARQAALWGSSTHICGAGRRGDRPAVRCLTGCTLVCLRPFACYSGPRGARLVLLAPLDLVLSDASDPPTFELWAFCTRSWGQPHSHRDRYPGP